MWGIGTSNEHGKGAPRASGMSLSAQGLLWFPPQDNTLQVAGYRTSFITIFQRRNWGLHLEGIEVPREIPIDALFSQNLHGFCFHPYLPKISCELKRYLQGVTDLNGTEGDEFIPLRSPAQPLSTVRKAAQSLLQQTARTFLCEMCHCVGGNKPLWQGVITHSSHGHMGARSSYGAGIKLGCHTWPRAVQASGRSGFQEQHLLSSWWTGNPGQMALLSFWLWAREAALLSFGWLGTGNLKHHLSDPNSAFKGALWVLFAAIVVLLLFPPSLLSPILPAGMVCRGEGGLILFAGCFSPSWSVGIAFLVCSEARMRRYFHLPYQWELPGS